MTTAVAPGLQRARIRALAKVFFGRLFENDVFSSSVAASSGVVWLLALVATPGVMFSASQIFAWAHLRAMGVRLNDPLFADTALMRQQAFHLNFVMAIAGLVTMMVWSSLTPDRRDAQVLGPLPITAREQSLGRLLALLKFFALFIVAVSVPTAFALHFVAVGSENLGQFPGRVLGHIVGATLAGGSVFFSLLATQLAVAALFGPRAIRFITLPLQLCVLAGMVAALAFSATYDRSILENGMASGPGVFWNPAAWFLGVYRWVSGDSREVFQVLAGRGATAGLVIIGLTLLMYPLAYDRCLRNVIASEGRTTGALSRVWSALAAALLRPFLPSPLQRGLAAYMLATLARSHTHRFLIGSYAGIALLLSLPLAGRLLQLPVTGEHRYAWFAIPLGFVFWMVCGVRVAVMMPIEPSANWLFKITEPVDKRKVLSAVTTVMAALTCVPVALVFAGAALVLGEQRLAATVLLVVSLAGLCLIEFLTLTLKTVPFTCTYLPGQLKLRVYWAPYFFLWLQFVFTLSNWSLWAFQGNRQTFQLAAFLGAVWVGLRLWHMARARKITAFIYDEQEPSLVTTMDIATSMRQI